MGSQSQPKRLEKPRSRPMTNGLQGHSFVCTPWKLTLCQERQISYINFHVQAYKYLLHSCLLDFLFKQAYLNTNRRFNTSNTTVISQEASRDVRCSIELYRCREKLCSISMAVKCTTFSRSCFSWNEHETLSCHTLIIKTSTCE